MPVIVDSQAHVEFENMARASGYDPANEWVGGYVNHQWRSLKHVLKEIVLDPAHERVLEFGCNFGAAAVTAAMLGIRVTAIDIDANLVQMARLNAQRYGVSDLIEFRHVRDTRALPFESGAFDLIICCSVLEYVDAHLLASVQREIDRVTADGGIILITGTSNRLSPWEVHSRLWLLNYLPRIVDRLIGRELPRGALPWTVRYGFGRSYENLDYLDSGRMFMRARKAFGMSRSRLSVLRLLNVLCHACGFSVGMVLPNMSMTLRKVKHS